MTIDIDYINKEIAALIAIGKAPEPHKAPQMGYRYELFRYIDTEEFSSTTSIGWLMLNPSTADATKDDPTIRKCKGFTRRWGYNTFMVANLFALRSTQPSKLLTAIDPVGSVNDTYIRNLNSYEKIILAWGGWNNNSQFMKDRVAKVLSMIDLRKAYCIGFNKSGTPIHPLMAKYTDAPVPWSIVSDPVIDRGQHRLGLIKWT